MIIISHRGYWKDYDIENNKKISFERSFDMGYGIETDLRDFNGEIVISHDVPCGNEMTLEEVLDIMNGRDLLLALNIKEDGISDRIESILDKYKCVNYFVFDMSLPELYYEVNNTNLKVFTGCSDINRNTPLLEETSGVWLDSFQELWYERGVIDRFLKCEKKVCIVSEDLHGRENKRQWKMLRENYLSDDRVILCTNKLESAIKYFQF